MTIIFHNLNSELLSEKLKNNKFLNNALNFIKTNRFAVKVVSFCIISVLSLIITVMSVGIRLGFDVNYSGKVIATVSDASVFDNAKEIAVKTVNGNNAAKAINSPKFVLTLTVSDNLTEADTLANAIIENTDEIISASALVVDGETLATASGDEISKLVEERKTAYFVEGAENSSEFLKKVEIIEGYYLKSELEDNKELKNIVSTLEVKTVSTSVSEDVVPFTVKKLKTASYQAGYHKIYKAGQNGLSKTTVINETINGNSVVPTQITTDVITSPIEQVEIIGTAANQIAATERAEASSKGFIFPLKSGKYRISSYYGDGRNHKGVDICADKGTAIFAVSGGTVSYAGYDNDFGYNVIVDHGNGIKTRYAHASALCVSKGATVSQGDMIAAVGSTGWSSGNHLHFEVIVNGNRVNPAPYIGL